MAPTLPPMPLPGLIIVPGWTAQHQETFLMKNEDTPKGKCQSLVSYLTPEGKAGAPFLQIKEEESDVILFRTMEGQEAMRINVERHNIKLKTEYRALRSADAKAIWDVHLRISWRVPKWDLTVHDKYLETQNIEFEKDVAGEEKGLLANGNPIMTVSRHAKWAHRHAEWEVHVAPGMDLLLALGMAWIRSDQQKTADAASGTVIMF
ncbi:hypothetical protein AA0120_g2915 [Alternaria tenuissima]|uniref:Tubby C-terminal-like domain-containing protein n=1 Tax=Alternaria tenuissima TaxID=119927 RepID=A0A4V1WMJ9_9PLEO|nr:hypothetical protein AA0114_g7263 [Alternaria tenuissima]RYN96365.1 hypothetical protein AA0120_g2915 [Alternaria tenuissima]